MYRGEIRNPVMILLLSLITCGIYYMYWIYKASEEVQTYNNNQSTSPAVELILCLFTCGIYFIYWHYKYAKLIAECQQMAAMTPEDNSIVVVILSIFFYPAAGMILQGSMNKIWEQS